jgi:hypothetical protein
MSHALKSFRNVLRASLRRYDELWRSTVYQPWIHTFGSDIKCREFFAAAGVTQAKSYFAHSRLPLSTWMSALGLYAHVSREERELTAQELMRRFKLHDRRSALRMLAVLKKCSTGGGITGFCFRLSDEGTAFTCSDGCIHASEQPGAPLYLLDSAPSLDTKKPPAPGSPGTGGAYPLGESNPCPLAENQIS